MMTPVDADEPVDGQQAEVGRAVDEDVVVGVEVTLERFAQDLLATERGEQLSFRRREIDVGRRDIDAGGLGREDHLGERRPAVGQHVGHGTFDGVEIDAEAGRQVRLRIHVDAEDTDSPLRRAPPPD